MPTIEIQKRGVESERLKDSHLGVLSLLVRLGADLESEDDLGRTPLMVAAERDDLAAIKLLIAGGAGINHRTACGTVLHTAVAKAKPETIRLLLELGADVHCLDSECNTPLHKAASLGDVAAVQLFLRRGADPACENSAGATPLDSAARSGSVEVLQALADSGVPLRPDRLLNIAVESRQDPIALWLLSNEANLNRGVHSSSRLYSSILASLSLTISFLFCSCIPLFLT